MTRFSTRPAGLVERATPATLPDPYSIGAKREEARQMAARAAAAPVGIEYTPALTERERADLRLALELRREAANRGITPRALGVRR